MNIAAEDDAVPAKPATGIPLISRHHFIVTACMAFCAIFVVYLPSFPFDKRLGVVAAISFVVHTLSSIFFRHIKRHVHHGLLMFDIVLLAFALHYTGGAMSPFVVVFGCILVSGVYSGVEHPLILPTVLLSYAGLLILEFFGIIQPVAVTVQQLYASPWTTALVLCAVLFHLALTGYFYDIVMKNLRVQVSAEQAQKQQLIRKMAELEAPSQLGIMVAKIAHDVHGPLTAISGFLQLMKDDKQVDSEMAEDCDIMIKETTRISDMVMKLLRFVKADRTPKQPLCIVTLMDTLLTVVQFHPMAAGVQFKKIFPDAKAALNVMGNKDALQQAYFNVLKNALEALPKNAQKKEIVVSVERQPASNHCIIAIQDSGLGMTSETLASVSQGFHTTKTDGSGLGLVIVQEILKDHGGTFRIQSAPSKGTRVVTTLPLHSPSQSILEPR